MVARLPLNPVLDGFEFGPRPPSQQEQLYRYLRGSIVDGTLPAGARLPSTRQVAAELKVSRQLVVGAYERLHSEGMVDGQPGAGSFVSTTAGLFST